MLQINIADVMNVLNLCKPYLIFFGVVLALALITMIAVHKVQKPKRKMIRSQSLIAILVALAITLNAVAFGPLYSLISLAMGGGTISEESLEKSLALCTEIAEEGIVLLENEENLLPLTDNKKLNVFGWASTNPCYGGTGSGSLSPKYDTVSLLEGLEGAGFELNSELSDFYTAFRAERPEVGMWAQDWTLPEPTVDTYTDEMLANAKAFSDKAMIVITRVGGEGADLPTDVCNTEYYQYENNSTEYADFAPGEHYLQLSQTERNMVEMVCANFDDVVVVYNGANAMELGFVNEYPQIKSAIWCPGTGQSGFEGLGEIVSGEINPSAKTADTFVAELFDTPTANNFGYFIYDNVPEFEYLEDDGVDQWTVSPTFVNYVEGIYTGYRFWETAAEEGIINYDEKVVFPFGHGLSYTTFTQEMGAISEADGVLSFDVTVTNTGDVAGKDVVEVYYNPPYTNGGIEKASANLVAFEKTDMLEPGQSQTITISYNVEDMASYDYMNAKAYVLEAGNYGISIRANSHDIIEEATYTVADTVVYSDGRSTDAVAPTNQFDHAAGDLTYLSRADKFANYEAATAAPESWSMSDEARAEFIYTPNFEPVNDESEEMPVTGAKNGLELVDMRGADYDDERWEKLLDQMTVAEMDNIIAIGGYQTAEAKSIGKVQTVDCDGPASIYNNFTGEGSIGFPSAVMIANTWNVDLAESFGEGIGTMADDMNISGWYAPAMNIHRSAFAGRNFEYYSEDGLLSGKMAANAVIGAEKLGVYAYLKHFALNDQETNRDSMLCTWSNEQAIREIYLKPFEIAVKEGGAKAVMSSFNYIGAKWAGGSAELLNNVLRDEWGFNGMVITDYFYAMAFMNSDQAIRNGGDFALVAYDTLNNHVKDQTSATSINAMRRAVKNVLYTVVNSRAYAEENFNPGLQGWQMAAIAVDVVLGAVVVALEVVIFKKYKKRTEEMKAAAEAEAQAAQE